MATRNAPDQLDAGIIVQIDSCYAVRTRVGLEMTVLLGESMPLFYGFDGHLALSLQNVERELTLAVGHHRLTAGTHLIAAAVGFLQRETDILHGNACAGKHYCTGQLATLHHGEYHISPDIRTVGCTEREHQTALAVGLQVIVAYPAYCRHVASILAALPIVGQLVGLEIAALIGRHSLSRTALTGLVTIRRNADSDARDTGTVGEPDISIHRTRLYAVTLQGSGLHIMHTLTIHHRAHLIDIFIHR